MKRKSTPAAPKTNPVLGSNYEHPGKYTPPKPDRMTVTTDTAWEPDRRPLHEAGEPEPKAAFTAPGEYEEEALCDDCMEGFMSKCFTMGGRLAFQTRHCPKCCQRHEAEAEALAAAAGPKSRAERWRALCPAAYLKTDTGRLARENKLSTVAPKRIASAEFVPMLLARPFTERGVLLTGDSRIGKTRLVFALLGRYYLAGHGVMYVYAPEFSDTYAALMGESASKGDAFLQRCVEAELWFLDDLGKGRLSESAQRALLRVIEKRTSQERPIFTTCNHDGDTLVEKMRYEESGAESEYARPMIERLREFCDAYQF